MRCRCNKAGIGHLQPIYTSQWHPCGTASAHAKSACAAAADAILRDNVGTASFFMQTSERKNL